MSAVQAHINRTTTGNVQEVPLPPAVPFNAAPPIPPVIDTNPGQAAAVFGRRRTRQPPSGYSSIGQVSINGRSYTRSVFNANGNRIA